MVGGVAANATAEADMLKFYFNGSPNPTKVALFLEEAGLPYEAIPVDTRKGEQFEPAFLAINPERQGAGDRRRRRHRVRQQRHPALPGREDRQVPARRRAARGELLSWLMFVATGVGPFSGQAVHFRHFAPEKVPYAHNRYQYEAERHYGILDERLAERRYMVGDTYTIVDMAVWGWARMVPFILGDEEAWAKFPNVKRLLDEIDARPAAARADGAQGQAHLQGRDGRRGARPHVQASRPRGCLSRPALTPGRAPA